MFRRCIFCESNAFVNAGVTLNGYHTPYKGRNVFIPFLIPPVQTHYYDAPMMCVASAAIVLCQGLCGSNESGTCQYRPL